MDEGRTQRSCRCGEHCDRGPGDMRQPRKGAASGRFRGTQAQSNQQFPVCSPPPWPQMNCRCPGTQVPDAPLLPRKGAAPGGVHGQGGSLPAWHSGAWAQQGRRAWGLHRLCPSRVQAGHVRCRRSSRSGKVSWSCTCTPGGTILGGFPAVPRRTPEARSWSWKGPTQLIQ